MFSAQWNISTEEPSWYKQRWNAYFYRATVLAIIKFSCDTSQPSQKCPSCAPYPQCFFFRGGGGGVLTNLVNQHLEGRVTRFITTNVTKTVFRKNNYKYAVLVCGFNISWFCSFRGTLRYSIYYVTCNHRYPKHYDLCWPLWREHHWASRNLSIAMTVA